MQQCKQIERAADPALHNHFYNLYVTIFKRGLHILYVTTLWCQTQRWAHIMTLAPAYNIVSVRVMLELTQVQIKRYLTRISRHSTN